VKRILVPLDFSDNSIHALKYALKLFNKPEDEVIACHFFDDESLKQAGLGPKTDPIAHYSEKISSLLNGTLTFSKAKFTPTARFGDFPDDVSDIRRKTKPDLFVMGTKGASGLKETFMGSNTSKLIETSNIPVLVIPEGCSYVPIDNVLFCSDLQLVTELGSLKILRDLAQLNNAFIRLANVKKTKSSRSSYDQTLERERQIQYLEEAKLTVVYKRIFSPDVAKGINFYVRKKGDVKLITVLARKHGLVDKMFNNSVSRKLAHHTQLPLLVLKELA